MSVPRGHLSAVGPRPRLPRQVVTHTGAVQRRLLVKRRCITVLWQVTGRADLSWQVSVRLGLLNVEDLSLVRDLVAVWRTLRAVVRPKGAC